jgi:TctA family transporter
MPDKKIRLRELTDHLPFDTKSYQSFFSSLNLLQANVNVTRYDIETASLMINVPNNPSAANTAIATRSLDTRGSESFALSINSL